MYSFLEAIIEGKLEKLLVHYRRGTAEIIKKAKPPKRTGLPVEQSFLQQCNLD